LLAAAGVALLALACASCGGGGGGEGSSTTSAAPPLAQAQGFADGFVQRLVAGRWTPIESDVAPMLTRSMRDFQSTIVRDGITRARVPGRLAHDCPPSPAVDAGKDCFVYRLSGQHIAPVGTTPLEARFRLWLNYEDGRWQAVNYSYDVLPGASS